MTTTDAAATDPALEHAPASCPVCAGPARVVTHADGEPTVRLGHRAGCSLDRRLDAFTPSDEEDAA
ncbi:MAG: hypothetical protein ABI808_11220 [Pseudonocardiales bacterium]